MTARVMDRDARLASDAAMRDASVQLCLLHEDLGLLRTVRVYGVEEYDRQRFDEHLERFQQADDRRMVTGGRLESQHHPALRRRAGRGAGAARLQRGRQQADRHRRRC